MIRRWRRIGLAGLAALCAAAQAWAGPGGPSSNLVINGSFDATPPLAHWRYEYKLGGESWYADNDTCISVIPQESGRKNVLRMVTPFAKAWAPGQGVKVDSFPIPIDPKGKYRLTVSARSTGPNCRILLYGLKWRPGIKPHPDPELHELRECYHFAQVYFGGAKGGDFGNVGKTWGTATMTFPDPPMTDLAKGLYEQIRFVSLHVVSIGAIIPPGQMKTMSTDESCLYVDDIRLEKLP